MRKYTYEFVTGAENIEISEEWAAILEEMDREEYNREHQEIRNCVHYECDNEHSDWLACEELEPWMAIEACVSEAKMDQLIDSLTETQKDMLQLFYVEGKTRTEIAEMEGVSVSAISQRLNTIGNKFKKLL